MLKGNTGDGCNAFALSQIALNIISESAQCCLLLDDNLAAPTRGGLSPSSGPDPDVIDGMSRVPKSMGGRRFDCSAALETPCDIVVHVQYMVKDRYMERKEDRKNQNI